VGVNVRITRVILLAIGLIVLSASILVYRNHAQSVKYATALETIREGDPKEKVVQLFGSPPEEITNCSDPHNILGGRCREVYWYYSFMERWEIYLDPDGKVITTNHSVSF